MKTIYSVNTLGSLIKGAIVDENYTIPGGFGEGFLCKVDGEGGFEFFMRKGYSNCWADTEKEAWELYVKYLDSSYEETLEEIKDLENYRDDILEKKKVAQEKLIEFSA